MTLFVLLSYSLCPTMAVPSSAMETTGGSLCFSKISLSNATFTSPSGTDLGNEDNFLSIVLQLGNTPSKLALNAKKF